MILKPEESERYYRIWWPLLHYVNTKRQLVPELLDLAPQSLDGQVAVKLRQALWEDDSLRAAFIAENPAMLSPADLDLVQSWDRRVTGSFYIFRYLKKHSLFITQYSPTRVYGVLGLISPIEEIMLMPLPSMVQAILLPFEDRIIYDGLLSSYNIFFGSGIKAGLNDAYREAKERGAIITSLLPAGHADPEVAHKEIRARNTKLLAAFQKDLARSSLSLKMIEQHCQTIATFGEAYLIEQTPPRGLIDLTLQDIEAYLNRERRANMVSFKRFARFLRDSGRMNWNAAEDIRGLLKG